LISWLWYRAFSADKSCWAISCNAAAFFLEIKRKTHVIIWQNVASFSVQSQHDHHRWVGSNCPYMHLIVAFLLCSLSF
jgi:hypothetical protein